MKNYTLTFCLALACVFSMIAQVPQAFNYQAQVRDGNGDLIIDTNVSFRFGIKQGSPTASPLYIETHVVATDDLGQVSLGIGQGTPSLGVFSEIDWSLGEYYLDVELDIGSGFLAMGVTQFLSVPYALYAESSGDSQVPSLEQVLTIGNSANNLKITSLLDPTDSQDAATKAYVDTQVQGATQNLSQVLSEGNDANGVNITGLPLPIEPGHAVNKQYVDDEVDGATQNLDQVLNQGNNAGGSIITGLPAPVDPSDAVNKEYVDLNSGTSPWYVNATMDSISFEKKVVVGSPENQNVPALTVIGTDTGPFSPSAAFIRSQFRNNVLLFETSEVENNYVGSVGLIEAATDFTFKNQFVIGLNDGIEWKNPLRFYFENKASRLGYGDDNYFDLNNYGHSSLSIGTDSYALGDFSSTLGNNTVAFSNSEVALGSYNTFYSPIGGVDQINENDRLLVVGNGTQEQRSDALIIRKSGEMSLEGNQIKNVADPLDDQDAATKSYVDSMQLSAGLMNFNEFPNATVWSDNETVALSPNSFLFINADNTTLDLPQPLNHGDVIYVYVMQLGPLLTRPINFVSSDNFPMGIIDQSNGGVIWTDTGTIQGEFVSGGLHAIIAIGDYWMISDFLGQIIDPFNDNDNDGFSINDGDCNDNDPNTYPGAPEICGDGVDQDCNGDIDDGACSADNDGDGFSINDGDCNDNDPNTYPGAPEIECDGIDQDCDGADLCTPPSGSCSGDEFTDDMESYTSGQRVYENWWVSWCGDESCAGFASDNFAFSGTTSFYTGPNGTDPVLDLGNKTSGIWRYNMRMYIPTGKEAYMNLQGQVPIAGGQWIVGNIFFNQGLGSPGVGLIDNSALGAVNFLFPHDQWFEWDMTVDISNGISLATWGLYVDGVEVIPPGTAFTDSAGTVPTSLGGINFYSLSADNELYIDDICFGSPVVDPFTDTDGDGFSINDGDCNDNDPNTYPGAPEIECDGIDQDCDGSDLCNPPPLSCSGNEFTDDMESYALGSPVNGPQWSEWVTGIGYGTASNQYSVSGTQSMLVGGDGVDPVLDLGNKIFGRWQQTMQMYIPSGKEAYMNLQGQVPIGAGEWIVGNIFFNYQLATPGQGSIDNSALGNISFNFPHDQWFEWDMRVDISNGISLASWSLYVDGVEVIPPGTAFTDSAGTVPTSLGGINIYSISANNEVYFDDVCYGSY